MSDQSVTDVRLTCSEGKRETPSSISPIKSSSSTKGVLSEYQRGTIVFAKQPQSLSAKNTIVKDPLLPLEEGQLDKLKKQTMKPNIILSKKETNGLKLIDKLVIKPKAQQQQVNNQPQHDSKRVLEPGEISDSTLDAQVVATRNPDLQLLSSLQLEKQSSQVVAQQQHEKEKAMLHQQIHERIMVIHRRHERQHEYHCIEAFHSIHHSMKPTLPLMNFIQFARHFRDRLERASSASLEKEFPLARHRHSHEQTTTKECVDARVSCQSSGNISHINKRSIVRRGQQLDSLPPLRILTRLPSERFKSTSTSRCYPLETAQENPNTREQKESNRRPVEEASPQRFLKYQERRRQPSRSRSREGRAVERRRFAGKVVGDSPICSSKPAETTTTMITPPIPPPPAITEVDISKIDEYHSESEGERKERGGELVKERSKIEDEEMLPDYEN